MNDAATLGDQVMKCLACGYEIDSFFKFCPACGKEQVPPQSSQQPSSSNDIASLSIANAKTVQFDPNKLGEHLQDLMQQGEVARQLKEGFLEKFFFFIC